MGLNKEAKEGLKQEKSDLETANKRIDSEINEWKGQKRDIDKKISNLESEKNENIRRIEAIDHTFAEFESDDPAKTEVDRRGW